MTHFDLLGYGLEVEDASPSLVAWLEDYWGFSHIEVPSSAAVKLRVVASKTITFPSDKPSTLNFPEGTVACINHDPIIWLGNDTCGVRLNLEGAITLEVWGEDPNLFATLHMALTEVLRVKGFLPLHAAVVVKDGRATAFLGASGSGKTTTLLTAVDQGWQALCEDFVWLEPATLQLYRWDRGLRLLPDTYERFGHLVGDVPAVQAAGKRFVRYRDLGWTAPESSLSELFWLRRNNVKNTERQTMTNLEATRLLWEATGVPISRLARENASRSIPNILTQINPNCLLVGTAPFKLVRDGENSLCIDDARANHQISPEVSL